MCQEGGVPVIPRETEPRATNRGISAAGRNTLSDQRQNRVRFARTRKNVQRYRVVLHQCHIESVLSVKLDVGAGEQLDALFVESAWGRGDC